MTGSKARGAFITIEGGEGGGKSTQAKALVARLRRVGLDATATREPGGSAVAEAIREALLSGRFEHLGAKAEALLFAAARIDHIDQVITPTLERGAWIVSDRFHDSTRAYQGAQGAVGTDFLHALEKVTLAELRPDLTLVLDLPAAMGLTRADARRAAAVAPDRFEKQDLAFHEGLRTAFLEIAAAEPDRCVIVDARHPSDEVEQAIWDTVVHRLPVPRAS